VDAVPLIKALFALGELLRSLPPELVAEIVDIVRATVAGDAGLAMRRARAAAAKAAAVQLARERMRR
jgi:hypothetical protein